jgi:spoIIIJ-associated protein
MSRPDEPAERLREMLEEVADAYGLDGDVRVEDDGEELRGTFEGDDVALLIGRRGQTIDALQHLAVRIALRDHEPRRIIIDAGGYRERRAEALRRQADRAAADAVSTGRPVPLEAMSAPERKLVHEYLREHRDIETYSEGEEPDRHLVVAPVV